MKPCISLLLFALSGLTAVAADSPVVTFKDSNLEATVRKFLPDSKPGERATVKDAEPFGMARTVSIKGNPLSASAKSQQVPELRKLLFDVVVDQ